MEHFSHSLFIGTRTFVLGFEFLYPTYVS